MARVSPKQNSFGRGEISPKLYGRQDTELYYTALELARNYIVDGRGILEKRPGTKLLGRTKNDGPAELVPFVYSLSQSYILEMGDQYLRAWYNDAQVIDGGSPSETATPYSDDDASELSYSQSRDTMWVCHADHPPSIIQRDTASTFTFQGFDTRDGPYLDSNADESKTLGITLGGSSNVGRGTFSAIPAPMEVGMVISIWDGSDLQTMTVTSVNAGANQVETDWEGSVITATTQWSYDGGATPAGVTLAVDGVLVGTTATLTAVGHTPFDASRDVGRWVRFLRTKSEDQTLPIYSRFRWYSFQIQSVSSSTVAIINWDVGLNLNPVPDWRLGAFYPGNYPSICTFHGNRLCFGLGNKLHMSSPGDYDNFSPSDNDSSVNPDNAITVSIPAVSAKNGAVSDITFMQSIGFQLLIGTPAGLHTIQSTSFGEAIKPDSVTRRAQDSRGASLVQPVMIGDAVVFVHSSRQKLMGTYYRDSLDRIGAQDLSLPSDHLPKAKIKGVTWQQEPHSIAWIHMDDGTVAGLTIQPEEKVQAWHSHRFGGAHVSGGATLPAKIESMATIPSAEGGDDRLHMIAKRTIDGSDARFVEVMQPYRKLGDDVRDAWYVDGGLKYEGNVDLGKTITFTGTGVSDRAAVTNFATPAFVDNQSLVFHDGLRWHHGLISAVDGSNNFTWTPTKPNTRQGPPDGRWHLVDGTWVQLDADAKIDVFSATYIEPVAQTAISTWSHAITAITGLSDYEGESLDLLIDGFPVLGKQVVSAAITDLPSCHVLIVGFGYVSQAKLLSIEAGSQNGSAQNKQRPVYEASIDVLESRELEGGTGLPSSYDRVWEQFDPIAFPDDFLKITGEPDPLYSGFIRMTRDEQGDVTKPSVSWRQKVPLPSIIRGIITRISESDGR